MAEEKTAKAQKVAVVKEEVKKKQSLQTLALNDLLVYEKAIRLVCSKYEKYSEMARGRSYEDLRYTDPIILESMDRFREFNNIHESVYKELEGRIRQIEWV